MNEPNERRAIVAIVLCLAVFYVWSAFFVPKPPPPEETPPEAPVAEAPSALPPSDTPVAVVEDAPCVPQTLVVSTDSTEMTVGNCTGAVTRLDIPQWDRAVDVTPWWTWLWRKVSMQDPGPWRPYGPEGGAQAMLGEAGELGLAGRGPVGAGGGAFVAEQAAGGVTLRRLGADGLTVTKTLAPTEKPDVFDYTITFSSPTALSGPLWVGVADSLKDVEGAYDMHPHLAAVIDGELEQLQQPSEVVGAQALDGPVSWFGLEDRYFLAALVPEDPAWGSLKWVALPDGRKGAFLVGQESGLAAGQPTTLKFTLYAGPKYHERLAELGHGLEEAVSLGFFGFFAKIMLFFLEVFEQGTKNWGLAILALTLFVRIAFYPLNRKAFVSGKMMQAVQPKLKEVQEKFKDDKEAQTRETMALFQKHGVNPLGGCFPILVQMPIFFALYSALLYTPDLFHADFLYITDLSAPDPYGALPAVMAVGMIVQQRMTPMTGMDPAQQQMMKFMPLVFALFMFGLPAGLSLYYALNTVLAIAQQWYNTRSWKPIELPEE
ncbi:MAG: membrane protein insertase YidC [Myxococcota bacterium]